MYTGAPLAADVLRPPHSSRQLAALEAGNFDGAAYGAAAVLTQLSELAVWVNEQSPNGGLLPLTRLQRLTGLYVRWEGSGHFFDYQVRWVVQPLGLCS